MGLEAFHAGTAPAAASPHIKAQEQRDAADQQYARLMARTRTQGDDFRRYLLIRRLPTTILMFALFVVILFTGLWPLMIVAFVLVTLSLGLTVWLFVLNKRADPEKLAAPVNPIDPSMRPSLRYLRPKKYPCVRPAEPTL
jgi:hypothetical protein